jgi:hypothetical protein
MEHLFTPCTRLHDIIENHDAFAEDDDREEYFETGKELNLDVSTEEFLSAERSFTYADLYEMIEDGWTVAWLTPHAAVERGEVGGMETWELMDESLCFCFNVDGKDIHAFARSHEHLLEICDVVLRLLAVSVAHSVILRRVRSRDGALINATSLEYLMKQCQSLICLSLHNLDMNENHCRVLGTYSVKNLQIELDQCRLTGAAGETMAEVLGRNQGPTKLDRCDIDNFVLASGLRGNSRLQSLTQCDSTNHEGSNRGALAIVSALGKNKGLFDLKLGHDGFMMSDETWDAVCDSLKTHPTLQVLHLRSVPLTQAVVAPRIQALLDMIKVNISIHTMHLPTCYSRHAIFRESVIPYLETNKLRLRFLPIQTTRPIMYRVKVLGRALLAVRTDPNSFWMLLSGNAEVAFASTTATTTPAVNLLPTPISSAVTIGEP